VRRLAAIVALAASVVVVVALSGCGTMSYYWQGIRGEIDILQRAQPIPEVVDNTDDATLRAKLERSLAIRAFASRELKLPDNGSYKTYAALDRRFVLWNVVATPELSLEPRQWCFPIAGCVNYRGYFDEGEAKAEALQWSSAGDDVHIGGVPAFSTLGWFNDPILSTFVRYPDAEVARLMFHELAHQVAYAKDDSVFNESFAVAVEQEGLERWLTAQGDPAVSAQYESSQRYREGFRALIDRTRARLTALYRSNESNEEKRAAKTQAFAQMREEYAELKRSWGGFPAYDGWFAQGPNNASLAGIALYSSKVPQFKALLAEEGGDLPRFYARVKVLSRMPKAQRDQILANAGASAAAAAPPAAP
jgi:predicted aminopeptidase